MQGGLLWIRRSIAGDLHVGGPLTVVVAGTTLAGVLAYTAAEVSKGVLHVVLVCLAVLASVLTIYLLAMVLVVVVLVVVIERLGVPRPEGLRDRWPAWARVLALALALAWASGAWLSGYDTAEWMWTAASVAIAELLVAAITWRRRRRPVLDGPDVPRHRSRSA